MGGMVDPVVLQTGPETFRVLLGGGRELQATLRHTTRRGLGAHGVPPVVVATEVVRFLLEHGDLRAGGNEAAGGSQTLELGAAAGRHPGFVDELRSRLG